MTSVSAPVQASFDDLGTPLVDVEFCILDLETTGTDRTNDRITEIGAVKVRCGQVLGTFQTLVNPGRAIPPQISVLTGLTDALVASAPRIEAVLGTFARFIGDAVVVGHNVGFDLGFLRAAFERGGHPDFRPTVVDTVALARRLVRDEVPDCKLSTLASRFRLDHRPAHRALDDALATTDLLHLLIERASGFGVTGLDDLIGIAKLAGHPLAAKLDLTTSLPRAPGVYLFRGARDEVLYVGKATDLRQRVRSYFGSDSRRKVGALLREVQRIDHVVCPDPVTAEVLERRLIARDLPRYNRAGTRVDRYCYVRLDVSAPWPRLSVVRRATADAVHLGPLTSRAMANQVIEAIQDAVPLRRCSTRLTRRSVPAADAAPCAPAQLGVCACPCAGDADAERYAVAVATARRTLEGDAADVLSIAAHKMATLAAAERFEEAASVRDRATALASAVRRHHLIEALRAAGRIRLGDGRVVWTVDHARLVDATPIDRAGAGLPVAPPDRAAPERPLEPCQVDEALVLARHLDRHHRRLDVIELDGEWRFPVAASDQLAPLDASTITTPDGSGARRRTVASTPTAALTAVNSSMTA